MDPDWVAGVRRFEHTLQLVRREQASSQADRVELDLRDVLRLTASEQSLYRQVIQEASTLDDSAGKDDSPFLQPDEARMLFLGCDYTVWGELSFVLRSLLRQAFLELRTMRTLPLGDDRPFVYARKVRLELNAQDTQ